MATIDNGWKILPATTATDRQGRGTVVSVATGAAAVSTSLWTMTKAPEGACFVTFEAVTTPAYVRLRGDNGAAGTTIANGQVIPVGQPIRLWVDPSVLKYVDHISTGVGTLKWYVSSPVMQPVQEYQS